MKDICVWIFRVLITCLFITIIVLQCVGMPAEMTKVDVVTIMLGATGVMLAILTIFLAIAALIGYFEIRRSAHRIASSAAEKAAQDVAQEAAERVASQAVEAYMAQRFEKPGEDFGVGAAGGDNAGRD